MTACPVIENELKLGLADGCEDRSRRRSCCPEDTAFSRAIATRLDLVADSLPVQRLLVRAGERVHRAGQRFTHLHLVNAGFFRIATPSPDGREQIVGLKFRGDWLGFDGIAAGVHDCDATAMDTGEVWALPYAGLVEAGIARPRLLAELHEAMSRDIVRDRGALMTVCTLPADARVADFLRNWACALGRRGLRTDQITMRMTRAEIGNFLGVTLETVSRALSRLAREGLIRFVDRGRRELRIPDIHALADFVQAAVAPPPSGVVIPLRSGTPAGLAGGRAPDRGSVGR